MANEKIIEKKKIVVDEIKDKFDNSVSIIFFDSTNLKDHEITKLRKDLREFNSEVKVYKNTLVKRALDFLKLDMNDSLFGPNALVFGQDEVSSLKVLTENKLIKIKGGIINKEVSDMATLEKLSKIPNRETLLTMLSSSMIAIVRDLSICLDLYSKEKN